MSTQEKEQKKKRRETIKSLKFLRIMGENLRNELPKIIDKEDSRRFSGRKKSKSKRQSRRSQLSSHRMRDSFLKLPTIEDISKHTSKNAERSMQSVSHDSSSQMPSH